MRVIVAAFMMGVMAQDPATITPEAAAKHVGETVVVQGVVTRVHTSDRSNTTYLDFGPKYPDQIFTAVIFSSAQSRFPAAKALEGKTVMVKGTIRLYKGKPEIVLEYAEQLRVAG